ncbi:MAG: penicillin-binding protein activator LpoB [Treponema sp.]|jgi:hypothetical protein|nr:penicillin-binding protein activator LpoB [Treponema sp.]
MKKAWILFVLVFLAHWVFAEDTDDTVYRSINDAIKSFVREMSEVLPASLVAVVSMETSDAEISKDIIRRINVAVTKTKKQQRIEREESRLADIYKELNFQASDKVDQKSAQSIGEMLGVQFVIYGSYKETGNGLFELEIVAAGVNTAAIFWEDIKKGRVKSSISIPDWNLSLGLRAGGSARFYALSNDIQGEADAGGAFEGGFQVGALFGIIPNLPNLEIGLQTELLFSGDTVKYSGNDGAGDFSASFTGYTLAIPLLAKVSYRLGDFVFPLFLGPVFNIPLGDTKYSSGDISGSYTASPLPAGFTVGIAPGLKLGPGTLFADIRFTGDFKNTAVNDGAGTLEIYRRNALSFSLGYEIGIRN